jgi:hypothetical protein
MRIKAVLGRTLVTAALIAGAGAAGMAAASASPSNAPTSTTGLFTCPGGVTGTFVVNSGKASAPTTWNVAHLTFDSGGSGIFVPTALHLTITSPEGIFHEDATKGNAPGSVTCSIVAPPPPAQSFLRGTVVGNIVRNG